jgi:hypothetical protein
MQQTSAGGARKCNRKASCCAERYYLISQSEPIRLAEPETAGPSKPSTSSAAEEDSETESDSDVEIVPETDQERRRSLRDALHEGDIDNLKSSRWDSEWADDFVLPTRAHGSSSGAWTATNGESGTSNGTSRGLREVQKTRDRDQEGDISGAEVTIERGSASSKPSTSRGGSSLVLLSG